MLGKVAERISLFFQNGGHCLFIISNVNSSYHSKDHAYKARDAIIRTFIYEKHTNMKSTRNYFTCCAPARPILKMTARIFLQLNSIQSSEINYSLKKMKVISRVKKISRGLKIPRALNCRLSLGIVRGTGATLSPRSSN